MDVDGVGSASAPVQQPEQPDTSSTDTAATAGADQAAPSEPQSQPQQAQSTQDTYEAPRARGPVDLSGSPRYQSYDVTAAPASTATANSTAGAVTDSTASSTATAAGGTGPSSPDPDARVRLLSTSASTSAAQQAQPVTRAAEPERPATAVDPSKTGVVLNDQPTNLPTARELRDLGVTSARITLNDGNFRPDDTANVNAWKEKLDDYRANDIDTTLNLPRELHGSGEFPDPPAKKINEDGSWSPRPSEEQPESWRNQFDQWKRDNYLPAVDRVINTIGTVGKDDPKLEGDFAGKSRVSAYEIWNEPDERANRDYAPGIPAKQFGEVLRDVYQKINGPDADPNNAPAEGKPRLVAGGLDSGDPNYLDGAQIDGKLYANTIGVHPYAKRPDDSYDPNAGPNTWFGTYQQVSEAYGRFGKPLTFTEVGDERGYGENVQPGQEDRFYPGAAAASASHLGNVDRAYVFWRDPYNGRFGITDPVREDPSNPDSRIVRSDWRPHAFDLQQRIQQWQNPPSPQGPTQ